MRFVKLGAIALFFVLLISCTINCKRLKKTEMMELAKEKPGELLMSAVEDLSKGKPAGAYRALDILVKTHPDLGFAVFYRGLALHAKTQKKGDATYKKVFPSISADLVNGINLLEQYDIDDQLDQIYYLRAVVYKDSGMYDEAMSDCEKALELNAESIDSEISKAQLLSFRGMIFLGMEKFEDCIVDFTEAIALDPGFSRGESYDGRAICYLRLQQYDEALNDVERGREHESMLAETIEKMVLEEMAAEASKGDNEGEEDGAGEADEL